MNIYKAIIADDEEWAIKDLLAIIDWKKQGFEIVKTTTNSNEVLEILKQEKPDLLLTDIKMPDLDGIELLRRMREVNDDTITILISAFGEFEYAQKAIEFGAFSYILKPVDANELLAVLERVRTILDDIKSVESTDAGNAKRQLDFKNMSKPIREIVEYIDANYAERLLISNFSEQYFFNASYLSNLFKKETGKSFSGYLIEKRLEIAEKLLKDKSMKLAEVSSQVGYDDYYHFSKLFKKYKGLSPLEYRNKTRGTR